MMLAMSDSWNEAISKGCERDGALIKSLLEKEDRLYLRINELFDQLMRESVGNSELRSELLREWEQRKRD
jgi:hypothetical protein